MEPFVMKIEGFAEIPHPAERALIDVVVSSSGTNKAAVSEEVITTAKHVENLLRELSPADETPEAKQAAPLAHWSKTSLSATSYIPQNHFPSAGHQEPRQYKASINFDIRFKEFKALGGFGGRLAALPHVEVNDIKWILTHATENSFRSQLRKEATRDALQKVKDYCEVLNCKNFRPVELDDPHGPVYGVAKVRNSRHVYAQELGATRTMQTARRTSSETHDHRGETFEFSPEEVKMSMQVHMTFHAE